MGDLAITLIYQVEEMMRIQHITHSGDEKVDALTARVGDISNWHHLHLLEKEDYMMPIQQMPYPDDERVKPQQLYNARYASSEFLVVCTNHIVRFRQARRFVLESHK